MDYVVAHELCHLRHEGHGRAFWATLGRAMPDYEASEAGRAGRAADLMRSQDVATDTPPRADPRASFTPEPCPARTRRPEPPPRANTARIRRRFRRAHPSPAGIPRRIPRAHPSPRQIHGPF